MHMNKRPSSQQFFVQPSLYITLNEKLILQDMSITFINLITRKSTIIQKQIWAILVEKKL